MKALLLYICLLLFFTVAACKKNIHVTSPFASLKIVNTVTGGKTAKLNNYSIGVANNANFDFTLKAGSSDIYVWPFGDSLHPYFVNNKTILEERELYTLFLGGIPDAVEALLIKENFPYRIDSTAAIRFVHFSPNGPVVNVTLSSLPAEHQFASVNYKDITDFKYFPATSSNTSYTFQVRNASTNAIISTITMSGASLTSFVPRFRFVTLVFRGKVGGTPGPGITRVNHY